MPFKLGPLSKTFQEKCFEQHIDLYDVFIDLAKSFDRETLWALLESLAIPRHFFPSFTLSMMICWISSSLATTLQII